MKRVKVEEDKIVSIETLDHLPDDYDFSSLKTVNQKVIPNEIYEAKSLPCVFDQDATGNITRVYNYLSISVDEKELTADGRETSTITVTVDDSYSEEDIEFYDDEGNLLQVVEVENGQVQLPVTADTPGDITIIVKSTTKYGEGKITIKAVEAL